MRSKADETFVIVETLICPLQISNIKIVLNQSFWPKNGYFLDNYVSINDWL